MNGSYRTADGQAQIDWTLKDKDAGPEFSASGDYQGSGGQCLEEIAAAYPGDAQLQRIVAVWRLYHLNGMKAGLPHQEQAVADWISAGNKYDFTAACEMLASQGLLVIPVPEGVTAIGGFEPSNHTDGVIMYRYGTRWIYRAIPQDIIKEIKSWQGHTVTEPLHERKAIEFIRSNGLSYRISLSDSKPCPWSETHDGHHYRVTISRAKAGRLSFDFWGSINDAQQGRTPSAYTVLSAISSDVNTPDTFSGFCAELGHDADSIKARQTFNRVRRFSDRLNKFFSAEELTQLSAIQ